MKDENDRLLEGRLSCDAFADTMPQDVLPAESACPIRQGDAEDSTWADPLPVGPTADVPEFPAEVFPAWLRNWVIAVADALQCPLDLPAMLALAILSLACAKKFVVQVRSDWEEPVNLYIAVALKPGESKSPAFAKAIQPIVRFVAEQWKCLEPQIKTATARYDIVSKRIEQLKARAAKEDDPGERATIANEVDKALMEQAALQVPILPRLIVDDATAESLELVMRQQGGRIGIFSDEGGPFELMGGRYSDGIPNLDVYLKGHSGSSISTDRIGRVGGSVQNPAITIGLAIQPDVIMELHAKKGFRGRGLLARFLWVVPQSRVGTRHGDSPPVPRTVQETYEAAVTRLLSAPMERDKQGEIISRAIPIDERAYAILVAFKDTIEPALGSSGDLEAIADWGNKLPGTVVRLACLLHLADRAGETDLSPNLVGEREMLRALQISEFLCAHARIAFDMMDSDPIARSARHVLAWIQRTGATSFTGHQAYQALRAHFRAPAEMEAPLGLLIDHEIIRQRPAVPRTGPGRKPTPTYDVNPAIHARNTRNAHCPAFQLGNGDSVHFVQGSEEPISQSSDLPVQERRPTDHV